MMMVVIGMSKFGRRMHFEVLTGFLRNSLKIRNDHLPPPLKFIRGSIPVADPGFEFLRRGHIGKNLIFRK